TDVHHHCRADDLGGGFEISEGIAHFRRLQHSPSDSSQIPLTLPLGTTGNRNTSFPKKIKG
ncbi:MAG: hypothetical protein OXE40_12930, partial [Gammaproteobacteria bacterium]|nr:hypothetical protein [Gammaproteobacteria bacterium]